MKERIRTLMSALDLNAGQFADEIGVQKSGMSHILTGRNNPSMDFIQKILLRFPTISTEWLIMGKGMIFKGGTEQLTHEKVQVKNLSEISPDLFSGLTSPGTSQSQYVEPDIPAKEAFENPIIDPGMDPDTENLKETGIKIEKVIKDQEEIRKDYVETPPPIKIKSSLKVERILFFYSDNTFKEYLPQ